MIYIAGSYFKKYWPFENSIQFQQLTNRPFELVNINIHLKPTSLFEKLITVFFFKFLFLTSAIFRSHNNS